MTTATNLKEIVSVVEQVRLDTYPDVSATLLETIISIEEANSEDDDAAQREIDRAVTEHLRQEAGA
jgi:hypothetical protein